MSEDSQGETGDPEVDEPVHPKGSCNIEHHEGEPHPEVDRRSGKPRVKDREVDPRGREPSSGGDVPSSSKVEVGEDRVGVDLGGEDLKDGRHREEVLAESVDGASGSSLRELCDKEGGSESQSLQRMMKRLARTDLEGRGAGKR